jgi:proteic killer suppression protein
VVRIVVGVPGYTAPRGQRLHLPGGAMAVCKQIVYNSGVIENFANSETEHLFATGKSRRLPPDILRRAVMRLTQLDAAVDVDDLRQPPSNRLESLSGDLVGKWSIRINDRWRVCFRFEHGNAQDVEIIDYH